MLIDAIREEAQERAREKIEDARREANAIMDRAREEAFRLWGEKLREAREKANSEKRRIMSAAELECRRQMLADKQKIINEAFEEARRRLGEATRGGDYPAILVRLIKEATDALSGRAVRVLVREEDLPLASGIAPELRLEPSPWPISGGCIAQSEDGHCIFDNSFERRLERVSMSLRPRVSEVLFGEKGR